MLESLRKCLTRLDEAIEYAELTDMAWTKDYTYWVKERKILHKTIRKITKIERKLHHGS